MLEEILNPLTIIKTSNTNWIDLTDGGTTALHSHTGGGGALLASEYNPTATGGILLCSQYNKDAT
jgi:hypothetical protein